MIRVVALCSVFVSLSLSAGAAPVVQYRYTNWVIDNASVCFNYPAGSVEHRECRRYASLYFRAQCYSNKKLDANAHRMFCRASDSYTPI